MVPKHGPPDVLRVEERSDPEPGPGEVRIAVRAAGVSFADVLARMGVYPDAPKPPTVLGYEVAGEVDSVGEGVEWPVPGDRVIGPTRFGGHAERALTVAANVFALPEGWSFEEGAALMVDYGTAYAALVRYGSLRAGESVLIHSAAGGVGMAATEIAKLHDVRVFGTASAAKHDAIRSNGVDHAIDYRQRDFAAEVRRIAGEEDPLDLVMDPIGGRSFRRSFELLRPGGRLVCYGLAAVVGGETRNVPRAIRALVQTPRFNPVKFMPTSRAVIGLALLRLWERGRFLDELREPLTTWIDEGRIRPTVAETFPLERGAEAHRYLHARANVGKVVLTV